MVTKVQKGGEQRAIYFYYEGSERVAVGANYENGCERRGGAEKGEVSSVLMSWFLSHPMVSENHVRVLVSIASLWFIWRARNQARFEGGEDECGPCYMAGGQFH